MFLCSSQIHLAGKTLRPLLILGFRAGAFRHPTGEFPLRHLARQVGGLALGFCLFFYLTPWSTSSSTIISCPRTSGWRKRLRLPTSGHQPPCAWCCCCALSAAAYPRANIQSVKGCAWSAVCSQGIAAPPS
jgi:hypothetical protein